MRMSFSPDGSVLASDRVRKNAYVFGPASYPMGSLVKDPIVVVVDACVSPISGKPCQRIGKSTIALEYDAVS